ncbi:hypothetical protein [Desulfosporosinus youngiae]|uniref:Uncharacterized protein n=1 Tax=Desulfosporosinus youngiae DSM 17734 TaxID=768710 RepID=H5Y2G4_9FIRM|nr:hypothetical protein [Desulfosporosinus youngiae]EHQ88655.1 hypothetical protein DesyoDRAFT_1507 [Desulfosporosinus youngiae DSM 17734]
MKRRLFIGLIIMTAVITGLLAGCSSAEENANNEGNKVFDQKVSADERKRMDLYLAVMEGAFREENGGNGFIAVKLDTLAGLGDEAKSEVLNKLKSLSENVYGFDKDKIDNSHFEVDADGRLIRTLDGSLLWVEIKEYDEDKAKITGVSWFGNTGAVFPSYEAVFTGGKWQLNLISMAIS